MTGGCKQAAARSPAHTAAAEKRRTSPHTPLRRKDYYIIFISLLAGGKELEANTGIRD
jgi:hypothetical protein